MLASFALLCQPILQRLFYHEGFILKLPKQNLQQHSTLIILQNSEEFRGLTIPLASNLVLVITITAPIIINRLLSVHLMCEVDVGSRRWVLAETREVIENGAKYLKYLLGYQMDYLYEFEMRSEHSGDLLRLTILGSCNEVMRSLDSKVAFFQKPFNWRRGRTTIRSFCNTSPSHNHIVAEDLYLSMSSNTAVPKMPELPHLQLKISQPKRPRYAAIPFSYP